MPARFRGLCFNHDRGPPARRPVVEAGDLKQFAHLRRAALNADPARLAYRKRTGETDRMPHQHLLKALEIPI